MTLIFLFTCLNIADSLPGTGQEGLNAQLPESQYLLPKSEVDDQPLWAGKCLFEFGVRWIRPIEEFRSGIKTAREKGTNYA